MNTFTQQVGNFLDNRIYVLDGIEGVIRYTEYPAMYPYPHVKQHIAHEPTEKGKEHPQYKLLSQILHSNEHCTDLTNSEQLCDIVQSIDPNFELTDYGYLP